MGGFCCIKRKNDYLSNEKEKFSFISFSKMDEMDFNEEDIKEYYNKASKEESLHLLLKLIYYDSRVNLEDTDSLKFGWLGNPQTLGDLAAFRIFDIVRKKCSENKFECEESQLESKFFEEVKETHLISRMIHLLDSESFIKKDLAIFTLAELSTIERIILLMLNKEIIQKLFFHINNLRNFKYKNYKEHLIASLQIMRRIYVKNISLRMSFLDSGGIQLLYECIAIGDALIIQEVLYNIEDLVYVSVIV